MIIATIVCNLYLFSFDADSDMIIVRSVSSPSPNVIITGSPINSHYFSGLQLNLTCHIQLPMPMEYRVSISSQWSKSGSVLTSNIRMSVDEGAVEVGPLLYQSSLVFTSLDGTRRDNGDYTCSVTVHPMNVPHLNPVTVTASHTVTVESKNLSNHYAIVMIRLNPSASPFQLRLIGIENCRNWKASN